VIIRTLHSEVHWHWQQGRGGERESDKASAAQQQQATADLISAPRAQSRPTDLLALLALLCHAWMPAPRPIHPSIHHLACRLYSLFSLFPRLHRVHRVRSEDCGEQSAPVGPYGVASGTVVHHAAGYGCSCWDLMVEDGAASRASAGPAGTGGTAAVSVLPLQWSWVDRSAARWRGGGAHVLCGGRSGWPGSLHSTAAPCLTCAQPRTTVHAGMERIAIHQKGGLPA
jgi:hypothetical protein